MRIVPLLVALAAAPVAAQDYGYELHNGQLTVPDAPAGTSQPVTLLLDPQTGRTWALVTLDGQPTWASLPFLDKVPPHVFPPQPESP